MKNYEKEKQLSSSISVTPHSLQSCSNVQLQRKLRPYHLDCESLP
uniref:Uncharacterized protein n=1 Tax=Arundo donax TaxID=35708 RepID=A0A0A9E556_ARUDO